MAMNRQRKILCGLAAVAAAGVFVDRALLGGSVSGGPQSAAAAAVPTVTSSPTGQGASALAPVAASMTLSPLTFNGETGGIAGVTLAQRLAEVEATLPKLTPDAFAASDFWTRRPREADVPGPGPRRECL